MRTATLASRHKKQLVKTNVQIGIRWYFFGKTLIGKVENRHNLTELPFIVIFCQPYRIKFARDYGWSYNIPILKPTTAKQGALLLVELNVLPAHLHNTGEVYRLTG